VDLPRNEFKRGLADGRQQLGLWCSLASPYAAEIVAGSGYDWLLFDTEHSQADVADVLVQLQAVSAFPVSPVVRPPSNDAVAIKRLLDVGAQSLLIPQVNSADEAWSAVTATRYPPAGVRGVAGLTRATQFGRVAGYAKNAEQELCVLVQVETRQALEELGAILDVEGVDGVFVGPADLAASLGYPGEQGHPAVVAAVEDALTRIVGSGMPAGVLTTDGEFAQRCIDLGTTFTAVGVDIGVLARGTEQLVQRFRPTVQATEGTKRS
jgi:4-hydroxy-2-oxoheptanedioate aldolase